MQSTGFNIDDYISSDDDDSFAADKKRPTGEDEGDLLFKDGYGVTGAALPGLLESMMDVCLPTSSSEDNEEAGDDAAAAPDINDDRVSSGGSLQSSPSSSRSQRLRHAHSSPDSDLLRTFGRSRAGAAPPPAVRPRAKSSKQAPSWLPSEDWARHNSAAQQVKRLPSVLLTVHRGLYEAGSEEAGQQQKPCRGQKRLSALGTPYGRAMEGAEKVVLEKNVGGVRSEDALKRSASNNSTNSNNRSHQHKKRNEVHLVAPLVPSPVKEEVDPALHARLRREAKAMKREEKSRLIREKRMPRACARPEEQEALARVRELLDQRDRGRVRSRDDKGRSVLLDA